MDQRADAMEKDLINILQTRMALADKIQRLEEGVQETMLGTKAAVVDAINHAKEKTAAGVELVSHKLNPFIQGRRRPWVLLGSAIAIGLAAGWIGRMRRRSGVYPYYSGTEGADVMPSQGAHRSSPSTDRWTKESDVGELSPLGDSETLKEFYGLWDELAGELVRERRRLQAAALEIARSFIQDLSHILGQMLLDQLAGRHPDRQRPEENARRRASSSQDSRAA